MEYASDKYYQDKIKQINLSGQNFRKYGLERSWHLQMITWERGKAI